MLENSRATNSGGALNTEKVTSTRVETPKKLRKAGHAISYNNVFDQKAK